MTSKRLTAKQSAFVDEFLVELNGTQAAIRAGYGAKSAKVTASQNLTKPNLVAALQDAMAERAKKLKVKQEWVLEKLVENVERAMQVTEVLDREGEPTGVFVYQGAVANKALELIGRHLGMFSDKGAEKPRDYVPLEERVLLYQRENDEQRAERQRAIDEAANVSHLDPPASNR